MAEITNISCLYGHVNGPIKKYNKIKWKTTALTSQPGRQAGRQLVSQSIDQKV